MSSTQPSSSLIDEAIPSGVEGKQQTPVQLDGRIEWRPVVLEVARYWHIPALTIAYGVHRLLRRHVPRRSAPWTSLRLSELYIAGGLGCSLAMKSLADIVRAYKDDNVAVVAVAGSRVQSASVRHSVLPQEAVQDRRVRELVCAIRKSSYTDGLRGKLSWWHHHIWVDKATYDALAATIVHRNLQADPTWTPRHLTDFDICTTFIALYASKRSTHISNSIWGAFAASIPIGIYMRRRALYYLPMNVVQRVLIGLMIYCDCAFSYHSFDYLQDMQDKHQVATAVTRVFGNMEEEIAETRAAFAPLWYLL